MEIKRCVLAVAAVAGLMVAGSGTASAVPSSESAAPPGGISPMDLVFTFFFGPDWMPRECQVLSPCPEPSGSSLTDFGSSFPRFVN